MIPIEPPRNPKSNNIITVFNPPMLAVPVIAASSKPVLSLEL